MALPSGLEIGLVASITGMTAVSLFTLYLQDRLTSRVEKLEGSRAEPEVRESKAEDEKGVQQQVEAPKVEEKTPEAKMETLLTEVAARNEKLDELRKELLDAKKKLDEFEKGVILGNLRLDVFEQEFSKVVKRVQETEDTLSTLKEKQIQLSA